MKFIGNVLGIIVYSLRIRKDTRTYNKIELQLKQSYIASSACGLIAGRKVPYLNQSHDKKCHGNHTQVYTINKLTF